MPRFKPVEKDFLFFEINLDEQFGENTREYFVSHFVDNEISMGGFENKYNNDAKGQPAIHPSVILKVILYSFMTGVYSMREMEDLTKKSLAYKYLTGNIEIDHTTIAKFMKKHKAEIEEIFSILLMVFNDMGLIDWSLIVTDGVRIPGNASKTLTGNKKQLKKKLEQYERLSQKLVERSERLENSNNIKDKEKERERINRQKKIYDNRIKRIKEYLKEVDEGKIDEKEKINLTDRDSVLLRTEKGFVQGYNVHTSFSNNDIIVNIRAENNNADMVVVKERVESVEQKKEELNVDEKSKHLLDKGYFDTGKMTELLKEGIELYVPIPSYASRIHEIKKVKIIEEKGDKYLVLDNGRKVKGRLRRDKTKSFVYRFEWRENGKKNIIDIRQAVVDNIELWIEYKENSEKDEWKDVYNKRIGKEHNFDTFKNQMGFNRIWRRGKENAQFEVTLYAIGFNLKKLFSLLSENGQNLSNRWAA